MHRFFWFMLNAQRSALRHLIIALLVTGSVGLGLTGCDFGGGGGPSFPTGTWTSEWGETYEIDTQAITYDNGSGGGYTATVISINEYQFNAGDTSITPEAPAAVQPGYAVIKYTAVSDLSWGAVGKYNIFRWAENSAGLDFRLLTQGGKYNDDYTVIIVFDTPAQAVNGATNAAGYFAYAGSYAR